MRMRIDGTYGGRPAWLEWVDGELDGTPAVIQSLRNADEALGDRPIEPEPVELDRPDLPRLGRLPLRVYFLCVDSCYGLPPIFDAGSTRPTFDGFPKDQRPAGAV